MSEHLPTLDTVEQVIILARLKTFHGHRARTAESLGIGTRTLGLKIRQYRALGIPVPGCWYRGPAGPIDDRWWIQFLASIRWDSPPDPV